MERFRETSQYSRNVDSKVYFAKLYYCGLKLSVYSTKYKPILNNLIIIKG
jgi:hypothetical protein